MAMKPGATTLLEYPLTGARSGCCQRLVTFGESSFSAIGNSPHQAEGVARRVAEHTESAVLVGVGHPGGAQRDHLALRLLDAVVGDLDVQVKPLRAAGVRKLRRFVFRGKLKGQPPTCGIGE